MDLESIYRIASDPVSAIGLLRHYWVLPEEMFCKLYSSKIAEHQKPDISFKHHITGAHTNNVEAYQASVKNHFKADSRQVLYYQLVFARIRKGAVRCLGNNHECLSLLAVNLRLMALFACSFDVLSQEVTESLEIEGMNSFALMAFMSANLAPLAEILGALFLRSSKIYFGTFGYDHQLYVVIIVFEHFVFVEISSFIAVSRSKMVCDFIAIHRRYPSETHVEVSGVVIHDNPENIPNTSEELDGRF
ncbi:hypothetical protein RF11_14567 [Thelohanellus kitauei]|uniref:Uncharacterized protein n=1 Tax=Thelohanellus kitauei TaxID=669202 RepID=A0A0C2M9S8_THEKT|nr:hypothetical protein RF11_14567 [Thelohanellus kitauei]